jgi:hemoglobin
MKDSGLLSNKHDIRSGDGIKLMVNSFYKNARQDPLLGPIFEHMISNWEEHLPTMYQFWERLLFGVSDYSGNPFQKHLNLPLEKEHFITWVKIFTQTVDEHFSGLKAEEVKRLAGNIANSFQLRMGITNHDFEALEYLRN